MSEIADQPRPCARAERDGDGCEPQRVVALLADDETRAVYRYFERPATVRDAAESLEIPTSTAYRTVARLDEVGLIRTLGPKSRGGEPTHYVQSIDRVSVTYDDPLRIECARNGMTLYCEPE